jgi:hypothetical protein
MSRNGKIGVTRDTVSMDTAVQFVLTNVPRSQLLEMYYWTQEQDILRIVRGLVALPMQTRQELMFFLDRLQHPRTEPLTADEDEEEFTLMNEAKSHILPH